MTVKRFLNLCLLSFFVATALPAQQAFSVCDFSHFVSKLINSTPSYMTGMVARLTDGRVVFSHGTIFDPHLALLKHVKTHFGEVKEVLWVGEMQGQDGKLKVANATAGMMDPKDTEVTIQKLQIDHKESNTSTLKKLMEEHPDLEKQICSETKWVEFDKDAPIEEMHIAPELKRIKDLRHDFRGTISNFKLIAESIPEYSPEEAREVQEMIKEQAAKLLKDVQTMDTYHFKSTTLGKEDVLKLIEVVKKYVKNGVPESLDETYTDYNFMNQFVQVLEEGTGYIHSLDLHIAHE